MPKYKPLKGFHGLGQPKEFVKRMKKLEEVNKRVKQILKEELIKKQKSSKK